MEGFTTLIGHYNLVALTLADGDFGTAALDSSSRLILDHSSTSVAIGDGTKIFSALEEDIAAVGGENGIGVIGVRNDTRASLVDADGDYSLLQINAVGELYIHDTDAVTKLTEIDTALDSIIKEEDAAHVSSDKGIMALAVRNDVEGSMVGADGDYAPFQVDQYGRLRTTAELDDTPGSEQDVGVDEAGDGLIDVAQHATNFVDLVSITVAAGETLYIKGCDLSADHLVAGRLIVYDDAAILKVIRAFPVVESIGYVNFNWGRAIEVVGGATITVKLQARGLRVSKVAHCGGGINSYKI